MNASDGESGGVTGSVWRRLLLSVVLALVPLLGQQLPIPGVVLASEAEQAGARATTSAFALGISPLMSAYILVELASLLVPRWRRLRHGMPEGRGRLNRAVVLLALVLATFQAIGIAMMLEAGGLAHEVNASLVVATLGGATGVMVLLAARIDRLGVLNGFVALSLVEGVARVVESLPKVVIPTGMLPLLALGACLALPIVAAWSAVRAFEPPSGVGDGPRRLRFSLPAGSLQPAGVAVALWGMPSALQATKVPFGDALTPLVEVAQGPFALEAQLVTAIALSVLFAVLLQRPRVVVEALSALQPERGAPSESTVQRSLALALVPTVAFSVLVLGCDYMSALAGLPTPLAGVLVLATALALDASRATRLYRGASDLVCVAEERRPYLLRALLAAAEREGVTLHASGVAVTSLLRVFAPYASVRLLCRAADAARAREVLTELFERRAAEPAKEEVSPARKADWNRPAGILTALGAVVIALLAWVQYGGFPPFRAETAAISVRGNFELWLVDDEADPFNVEESELPAGVAILQRFPQQRSYVRLVLQGGETLEAARRRIGPWLARLALPSGRRLAWGELREDENDDGPPSAFETYVVVGEPILSTADLVGASLAQDAEHLYAVNLRLDPDAAERFRNVTASHLNERIAIAIDGVVRSAPVIRSEISGGFLQLNLGGTRPETTKLRAERLLRHLQGDSSANK